MDIRDEIQALNDRETNDLAIALAETTLGPYLGSGTSRKVYLFYNEKSDMVIKIDMSHGHKSNVVEYSIWDDFSETKEGKRWLAKCFYMSSCGKVLAQQKLTPITSVDDSRLPKQIPTWMTDTKVQNWGVDKQGNVKCLDYANSLMLQNKPWHLKKAEWWSH